MCATMYLHILQRFLCHEIVRKIYYLLKQRETSEDISRSKERPSKSFHKLLRTIFRNFPLTVNYELFNGETKTKVVKIPIRMQKYLSKLTGMAKKCKKGIANVTAASASALALNRRVDGFSSLHRD